MSEIWFGLDEGDDFGNIFTASSTGDCWINEDFSGLGTMFPGAIQSFPPACAMQSVQTASLVSTEPATPLSNTDPAFSTGSVAVQIHHEDVDLDRRTLEWYKKNAREDYNIIKIGTLYARLEDVMDVFKDFTVHDCEDFLREATKTYTNVNPGSVALCEFAHHLYSHFSSHVCFSLLSFGQSGSSYPYARHFQDQDHRVPKRGQATLESHRRRSSPDCQESSEHEGAESPSCILQRFLG
jgi:hypothetical protein